MSDCLRCPVCSCAFSLPILHTGPRVQRASGIPCSLQFEGHETQTSGVSRRENVDVYLLFEIRIETLDPSYVDGPYWQALF